MGIVVTPMTEADIDGAITSIQRAFAEDPYNLWVYNDRSKVRARLPTNVVGFTLPPAFSSLLEQSRY
jgi:hypothetical protein